MLDHLGLHASLQLPVQLASNASTTSKRTLSNKHIAACRFGRPRQYDASYSLSCRTGQLERKALLSAWWAPERYTALQATRKPGQPSEPAQPGHQGPADDPLQSGDAAGRVPRRRRAPPADLRRAAGSVPAGQQHQGVRKQPGVQAQQSLPQQPRTQPPASGADSSTSQRQTPTNAATPGGYPQQGQSVAGRQANGRAGQPSAVPRFSATEKVNQQHRSAQQHRPPSGTHQPPQQASSAHAAPGWIRQLQQRSLVVLPPASQRLTQVPQPPPSLPPEAVASSSELTDRLLLAINSEVVEEQAAVKRLYTEAAVDRMLEDGLVLVDLAHRADGQLHGSSVWRFNPRQKGKELPFHRFNQRSLVLLSLWSSHDNSAEARQEAGSDISIPATVLSVGRTHLRVVVDSDYHAGVLRTLQSQKLPGGLAWRMDEDLTDATTKRQKAAIEELPVLRRCTESELRLRCIVLGSPQAAELSRKISSWGVKDSWRQAVQQRMQAMTHLNYSQKQAVGSALLSTLTLWQGPPGTGKTRTLLALIALVCGAAQDEGEAFVNDFGPVLATAGTNAAADNLLEGLVDIPGMKVVRVGQPASIREGLRHLSLAALAEATPQGKKALDDRQTAQAVRERAASGVPVGNLSRAEALEAGHQWATDLEASASKVLREAEDCILDQAQVVVSTCASAGATPLHGRTFRMVVIDEATQATEPMTLIPLVKGVEVCVMAGDPQQLPPTVKSAAGLQAGLDCTLFTRLADLGVLPLLLDTQYRMHPDIADLPSRLFYSGKLRSGVGPAERPLPRGMQWPNPQVPVALLPCEDGTESMSDAAGPKGGVGRGNSFSNMREAELAIRIVKALLAGGDVESAAILTPYAGQVRLLNRLTKAEPHWFDSVVVSSVDAYQGREADVVVFSTVRCNEQRRLGFVADPRRLNVAITRPRRGLVVVGSANTLSSNADWRQWLRWVKARSAITSEDSLLPSVLGP